MIACDTSVLVAGFARWHAEHTVAADALHRVDAVVDHVAVETFSVLTRLPPPRRVAPQLVTEFLEQPSRYGFRHFFGDLVGFGRCRRCSSCSGHRLPAVDRRHHHPGGVRRAVGRRARAADQRSVPLPGRGRQDRGEVLDPFEPVEPAFECSRNGVWIQRDGTE